MSLEEGFGNVPNLPRVANICSRIQSREMGIRTVARPARRANLKREEAALAAPIAAAARRKPAPVKGPEARHRGEHLLDFAGLFG